MSDMLMALVCRGAGCIGPPMCKHLALSTFEPGTFDKLSTGHRWAVKWGRLIEAGWQDETAPNHNAAGADSQREVGEADEPETHLILNIVSAALTPDPGPMTLFGDDTPFSPSSVQTRCTARNFRAEER